SGCRRYHAPRCTGIDRQRGNRSRNERSRHRIHHRDGRRRSRYGKENQQGSESDWGDRENQVEAEDRMMNRTRSAMTTITGIAVAGVLSIAASAQKPSSTHTKWTAETVLPLTCAQAWVSSGKSYAGILSIVQTEARISLANRSLTFPNTREAGQEAGKGI